MKYLFLVIGGGIFVSSLQAYREIGSQFFGSLGGMMAIAIFLIVQGFEAKPIIMTNGAISPFAALNRISGGRRPNLTMADPEELLDASGWAVLGYGIDFVCGLLVWPIMGTWAIFWDLVGVGAVTWGDVNFINVVKIIACVFLLQLCLQQYLIRGGRLPMAEKMGGPKNVRA